MHAMRVGSLCSVVAALVLAGNSCAPAAPRSLINSTVDPAKCPFPTGALTHSGQVSSDQALVLRVPGVQLVVPEGAANAGTAIVLTRHLTEELVFEITAVPATGFDPRARLIVSHVNCTLADDESKRQIYRRTSSGWDPLGGDTTQGGTTRLDLDQLSTYVLATPG